MRGAAADPAEVIKRAERERALAFDATAEAVSLYPNLLVGDLQIRRVIGREPPLQEAVINRCADLAYDRFLRLNSSLDKHASGFHQT